MWRLALEGHDSTATATIAVMKAENSAGLQVKWLERKAPAGGLSNSPLLLKYILLLTVTKLN